MRSNMIKLTVNHWNPLQIFELITTSELYLKLKYCSEVLFLYKLYESYYLMHSIFFLYIFLEHYRKMSRNTRFQCKLCEFACSEFAEIIDHIIISHPSNESRYKMRGLAHSPKSQTLRFYEHLDFPATPSFPSISTFPFP